MVLRTINAVFDSKCIVCGTKIPKGEQSTYDTEKKKMYCRKCKAVAGTGAKRNDPIEDIIVKEIKDIPKDVKIEVRADLEKELGKIRTGADTIIGEFVTKMEKETPKHLKQARDEVSKMISKEFGTLPRCIIEIKSPDGKVKKIKEITHEKFSDIIKLINADVPVFLMGAAGCGKNHICKQVSEALGLEFYFTNAVSNEYKITGFIDANGKFHETQFYKAFTEGGLFFFDEIDASVPEVLVLLNAAIENRYFNFPTGKVNAHSNFRVIAAGNTYGSGASIQYVGRYQRINLMPHPLTGSRSLRLIMMIRWRCLSVVMTRNWLTSSTKSVRL